MVRNKPKAVPNDEIPTSKFEDTEFDDLDDYLDDDFNHKIYLRRTAATRDFPEFDDDFELEFFKSFYRVLSFVKANLDRPLAVEKAFKPYGIDYMNNLITYADRLENPALRESRALAHLREKVRESDEALKWHTEQLHKLYQRVSETDAETEANAYDDEYDPAKRGFTRQLAMMLFDYLFPNLKNASTTAKAEFLSLFTGWNADGLRNKWSDYRRGNKDLLAQDAQKVAKWRERLKISDQQK